VRKGLLALSALLVAVLLLPAAATAAQPRIVALTPFGANTLAKLGVEPVAVGQTLGGRERFSPKLKGVPVLPLSHPNGPNLEQLASLEPDIVLSTPTWAKGNESMGDLGIRVLIKEPRRVEETYSQTLAIARLVGRLKAAKELVKKEKARVSRARREIDSHPRVMLILGVGRTPFVFLPNSWGGDLVTKAGGELLTGGVESSSGFERISDEVVVAENPDVIIAVPHADEDDIPSLAEYLRTNPAWAGTNAVEDDRIYISVDNSLLQAGTDVAKTIRKIRRSYLDNWPE